MNEELNRKDTMDVDTAEEIKEVLDSPGKLMEIDIDMLEPSPYNTYEVGDTSDLEGTISMVGVISPLTVVGPDENGKYQILAGERRYTAIKNVNASGKANIQKVKCLVKGTSNLSVRVQKLIIEFSNLETREFDKNQHRFNIIRILKEMADAGEIKEREIVNRAGQYMKISKRYRTMYLQIFNNGDEELMKLMDKDPEGKRSKVTVVDAARISSMKKEERDDIIEDIKDGKKPKDVIKEKTLSGKKEETNTNIEGTVSTNTNNDEISPDESIEKFMEDDLSEYDEDELFKKFQDLDTDTSLDIDTTGEIHKTINKNETEDKENYKNLLKRISSWTNRMKKKEEYTEDELEVIDCIKELVIHVEELDM